MKYLTKEWYELCQKTGLHFGIKVNEGAAVYDEALYLRLYKRKENEYVKMQHGVYDVDPRFMLGLEGSTFIRLDRYANNEEIGEDDKLVYHMPTDERERIQKMIEEYDVRPPFDEKKCREEFRSTQEALIIGERERLPQEISLQIADMRVFSLGYCTKDVLKQLKRISKANMKKVNRILSEHSKAQQAENVPQNIIEKFCFHDCQVIEFRIGSDIAMQFDLRGGFTKLNKITFIESEILKIEGQIEGSYWIYNELYCSEKGYEAHILFRGDEISELIISCKDIMIEKE